ncbi:MAG: hypothetical protein ACKPJD_35375, partial [Planctomycetaceae bacterium]
CVERCCLLQPTNELFRACWPSVSPPLSRPWSSLQILARRLLHMELTDAVLRLLLFCNILIALLASV